jgi:hypothetical protein
MCGYAALAFELGLGDGPQRRSPRSSDGAMLALRWRGSLAQRVSAQYAIGLSRRVLPRSRDPGAAWLASSPSGPRRELSRGAPPPRRGPVIDPD